MKYFHMYPIMKLTAVIILIISSCTFCTDIIVYGQIQQCSQTIISDDIPQTPDDWEIIWDNPEHARRLATDDARNVFATGWVSQNGGDVYLIKYSETGVFQWQTTWGNGSFEQSDGIVVLSTGEIILAGYRDIDSNFEKFIVCFDSSGNEIWNKTYGEGKFFAMDSTTTNDLVVISINAADSEVMKLTSQGVKIWNYTMTDISPFEATLCTNSADDIYFIEEMLSADDGDPYTDSYLYKLSSNGAYAWQLQVGAEYDNWVRNIALGPDENVYVNGWTRNGTIETQEVFVEKISPGGVSQWLVKRGGTENGPWPLGLEIDSSGRIYLITVCVGTFSQFYSEYWFTLSGTVERVISNETDYIIQRTTMDNQGNLILSYTGPPHRLMKRFKDTTLPIIQAPPDFQIELDSEGNRLRWNITEDDIRRYSLFRNSSTIYGNIEINVSYVEFDTALDTLNLGTYNFTLLVEDWQGNTAISSVFVEVVVEIIPTTTTSTTTNSTLSPLLIQYLMIGSIGFIVFVAFGSILVYRKRKDVGDITDAEDTPVKQGVRVPNTDVSVLRGAEFVGNKLRYKVKVANDSNFVITDVTITLVSYPRDSLKLDGDVTKTIPKIDPSGFRSPTYEFLPTMDCVKGMIAATISFVDHKGTLHSASTESYEIRAVCDLLTPETITPEDFELKLTGLEKNDITLKVEDWTPEEMYEKTMQALDDSNFFQVSDHATSKDGVAERRITGWAKGKYTGKHVGVQVNISGTPGEKGAICMIEVVGEDDGMIPPALDEISQRLNAWLCPKCHGGLPLDAVDDLKAGRSVCCPFCGVTMDR